MKIISKKALTVTTPHFAALVFSHVHIPGDERSRTNPGHGYPAENRDIVEYYAFDSRDEMERWVKNAEKPENNYARKAYQIIEAKPLAVQTSIAVTVA